MPLSLRLIAVAAAATAAACAAAIPARAAPAGCGASSYSYAGLFGETAVFGVGARLSAIRRPRVTVGHVAGWVGVGGPGLGPNGADEWIQVGISSTGDTGPALYYEIALPGEPARYVLLLGHVAVGRTFDLAVLEQASHPGSWRVWVDGTAVTKPVYLPGSHGAWRPVATAESWNGNTAGTCNGYSFRFARVRMATKPGGGWQPLTTGRVLASPGYHLDREQDTMLAAGGV
jgi:hypothetical protein